MKTNSMKNVMKKLVFPLVVCGSLWLGSPAEAQINSILPDETFITHYNSGKEINITVTFAGRFDKAKTVGTPSGEPQLRLIVNGEKAYAAYKSINPVLSGTWRTQVTYTYTVKPGDMAEPLKVYTPWEAPMNGWAYYDVAQPYTFTGGVLDTFTPAQWVSAVIFDTTMASSKVTIKTLTFNDLLSPTTVQATMTETWRVKTDKDVGANTFDFRVWTPNTNIVQIGTVAGAAYYQGTMGAAVAPATYSESAPFAVKGLSVGSAAIYVQRVQDHLANTYTAGTLNPILWTNYIRRVINVTAAPIPPAPPTPTVSVDQSLITVDETTLKGSGTFTVRLSEATNVAVNVDLSTLPGVQGNIRLWATSVVFPAGTVTQTVKFDALDGTVFSEDTGIYIVPRITSPAWAIAYYATVVSNVVRVANVAPVITTPGGDIATGVYQNTPFLFDWFVSDVPADTNNTMTVDWDFGDGQTYTGYSSRGRISHVYTSPREYIVTLTVTDKDGGYDRKQFKVTVGALSSTALVVQPIGWSSANYYDAKGIGRGWIKTSTPAMNVILGTLAEVFDPLKVEYTFEYNSNYKNARLDAYPDPYPVSGTTNSYLRTDYASIPASPGTLTNAVVDSFFYVWLDSEDQAIILDIDKAPETASPYTVADLSSSSGEGQTLLGGTRAVFSKEWRPNDNMGDINYDGIPDKIAQQYGLPGVLAVATPNSSVPPGLIEANSYNGDNDFLPWSASGDGSLLGGGSNVFATVGEPFTAILEVRGFDLGLNRPESAPEGPRDEPGTNPTLQDTDGDGMSDGWEYYFWYQASVNGVTGSRYNPFNVGVGTLITTNEIMAAFNPTVAANVTSGTAGNRDFDNDGLYDIEEQMIGTNPIQWDTDRDGMCDGWEMFRGLQPTVPDGNANPDGDYMAYTTMTNQPFVTVSNIANGMLTQYLAPTNLVLTLDAPLGLDTNGFFTLYTYGGTNGTIALGRPADDLATNMIVTALSRASMTILHFQVYQALGFDPRTAWTGQLNPIPFPNRFPSAITSTPNTRPFTSLDEYLLMQFMSANRLNGATDSIPASFPRSEWSRFSTNPTTPDSEASSARADGMPDGWELYVACGVAPSRTMVINPWNAFDDIGDEEPPADDKGDKLSNRREFSGTDSCAAYTNSALYGGAIAADTLTRATGINWPDPTPYTVVTITRPAQDILWINKYWPTDPWDKDTDDDTLGDGAENAFIYGTRVGNVNTVGTPTDDGSTCVVGGGLNPCSMDTDLDALTDTWENDFGASVTNVFVGVTNGIAGMDGTVKDASNDNDGDGLKNYQEYWVQAVRSFRYDYPDAGIVGTRTGNTGLSMAYGADPIDLFTRITKDWDVARKPWGWGAGDPTLYVLVRVRAKYVSTDPRDPDTDWDGMDDYYEMFHGLNPILGEGSLASGMDDRVALAYVKDGSFTIRWFRNDWYALPPVSVFMDYVTYPWLAGMPSADPDADGLLNLEEKLQVNTSAPQNYNTDPTPLWMTDSSELNFNADTMSVVERFYSPLPNPSATPMMFFWPGNAVNMPLNYKMYAFEMNEGYDTDNDGISDKAELINSRNNLSDPQDHDDPLRRQALWFSGNNSAASTMVDFSYWRDNTNQVVFGDIEWAFRSFTVELWARPEVVNREQVLIERSFYYGPSDQSTTNMYVRRNFRVGIDAGGHVYAMFENAGAHDSHTATVIAYGLTLLPNEWKYITARMDGVKQVFTLFVDGVAQSAVETALIPANGIITIREYPDSPGSGGTYASGALTLGAANGAPAWIVAQTWADYSLFYQGWIDEVRVWDGARSDADISSDYRARKRYSKSDLWQNRVEVAKEVVLGYTRDVANPLHLSPLLMHHYTFDNLFSADSATSVATSPRGFNDPQVTINRPADPDAQVGWWAAATVHSTVYLDYNYLPWVENGVDHLPIFGSAVLNTTNNFVMVMMTNSVRDSVYWTHTSAGVFPVKNVFPNNNDPYGFYYIPSLTPDLFGGYSAYHDLLPLGGAYARQSTVMWDGQGASGVWAETGKDSDSDGLPDWWEAYVAALYPGSNLGWNDIYPDGSGITTGERYLRDIASGWTQNNNPGSAGYNPAALVPQTADCDGDGMRDWWENLYNLNTSSALGDDGALGDADRDGLSNLAEYMVSEVYHFNYLNPKRFNSINSKVSDYFLKKGLLIYGAMFTDHDFMEDSWEDLYQKKFVNRYVYDPLLDIDEDGWSNWAECKYEKNALKSDPSIGMHLGGSALSIKDFPVPMIETRLSYRGLHGTAPIVINAYSDAGMSGKPDAVFSVGAPGVLTAKTKYLGFWAPTKITGFLSPGSIVPGSVFLRFTEVGNPSGSPAAVRGAYDLGIGGSSKGSIIGGTGDQNGVEVIGSIDYLTGEYEIDLAWFEGRTASEQISPTVVVSADPTISYMAAYYNVSQVDSWPKAFYLTDANVPTTAAPSRGYVIEGLNYFFAFMDLNNNAVWDAGEPCGVPDSFGTDVGWDRAKINIELTDYTPNYLRMTLVPAVRSDDIFFGTGGGTTDGGDGAAAGTAALEQRVRVKRISVDGIDNYQQIVLDKTLQSKRGYLHEGDLLAAGELGLDWGLPDVPTTMNREFAVYEVWVGDAPVFTNNTLALTFTNYFDSVRATSAAVRPINGEYVYSARPTFTWSMPEGYTAFSLQLRKGSPTGPLVYETGEMQAPVRDVITGNCVWQAPIHAGDRLPNGQRFTSNTIYYWHVMALNSKFPLDCSACWSDWKMFRLDVNQPMDSSGYGEIKTVVKYYGPATQNLSGRVKVQVFRTRDFTGVPEAQYTLQDTELGLMTEYGAANVVACMRGLAPSSAAGNYYVRAYIDYNMNGVRDDWESWGYVNSYGVNDTPYEVKPITVEFSTLIPTVTINIEDADTDQDWFPDAWEYELNPSDPDFLALTGPSSTWPESLGDTEINPFLTTGLPFSQASIFTALTLATTDHDGDGLGDLAELLLGSDASKASTADDGFSDGAKVGIGLMAQDRLSFAVTGLGVGGGGANVTWKLAVQEAVGIDRSSIESLAAAPLQFKLQYKPSLGAQSWTTVTSGTVTQYGVQPEAAAENNQIDLSQGFFRVQLSR